MTPFVNAIYIQSIINRFILKKINLDRKQVNSFNLFNIRAPTNLILDQLTIFLHKYCYLTPLIKAKCHTQQRQTEQVHVPWFYGFLEKDT